MTGTVGLGPGSILESQGGLQPPDPPFQSTAGEPYGIFRGKNLLANVLRRESINSVPVGSIRLINSARARMAVGYITT